MKATGLAGTVMNWEDLSFGFRGTPTILLIDNKGTVRASLVGKLPDEAETQVLRILGHPEELANINGLDGRQQINSEELEALNARRKVSLVDVRERSEFAIWHRQGAINIPLLEFDVRASFELDKATDQVIDCSQFPPATCTAIVKRVQGRGFTAIPFSEGLAFHSCETTPHGS
jgi:hypothetical protein